LAMALVDLPDAQYESDSYVINNHYACCGAPGVGSPQDDQRQQQSDAVVNWIRDARTPGEAIDLPPGTPIAALGDLKYDGYLGPSQHPDQRQHFRREHLWP